MKTNPLDNEIKNSLEKRLINPSQCAWNQLENRLDAETSTKKKNYSTFYWIAAFFILAFLSGAYVSTLDSQKEIKNMKLLKKSSSEQIEERNDGYNDQQDLRVHEEVVFEELKESKKFFGKSDIYNESEHKKVSLEEKKQSIGDNNELVFDVEEKVMQVVDAIKELQQNGEVTNEEIEVLLLNAQREIKSQELIHQGTSLDAIALLTEVEDELDMSFKEKVFEALKSGFSKVKTAVADRNQ